jgi:zinc transporter, ZIP family
MPTILLIFIAIPAIALLLGALISLYKKPSDTMSCAIQHLAGGIVFAAVAVELVPSLIKTNVSAIAVATGFVIGVILMLSVDQFDEEKMTADNKFPTTLALAIALDVFIDGLLIGISFISSQKIGIVISIALAIEISFLGLSLSIELPKRASSVLLVILLAVCILVGGVLGYTIVSQLPTVWQTGILAFGVAALLYLAAEELLVRAHQLPDGRFPTAMFFVGFLAVLLIH